MIQLGESLQLYTTTLETDDSFLLEIEQININKKTRVSTIELRGYILDYTINLDPGYLTYELDIYQELTDEITGRTYRSQTLGHYIRHPITYISREAQNEGTRYEHSRCHLFTHEILLYHTDDTATFKINVDVQAHRHDGLANYDYAFNSFYGYGDETYLYPPKVWSVRANLLEEGESNLRRYIEPEFPAAYIDEPIRILYKDSFGLGYAETYYGILKCQYDNNSAAVELCRVTHQEYKAMGQAYYDWTPSNNIPSSFFASDEYVKDITLVLEVWQTSTAYPNGQLYSSDTSTLKLFQSTTVERPGGVLSIFGSAAFEKYKPKTEGDRYARFIDDVLVTLTPNCYHGDATPYIGYIKNGNYTYMIDFANGETSKLMYDIEDDYFEFTVIDTLGRRGEAFKYLPGTFYEYFRPTVRVSETVLSGNTGTLTFTVEGDMYLEVYDSSGVKNSLQYATYGVYDIEDPYTPVVWDTVWKSDAEMNPTYGDATYSFTIEVPNLNYMRSYVLLVSIADRWYTATSEKTRARLDPMFDWGKDDFKFNVPVFIRPNGVEDMAHEVRITTSGNIELAGDIIINGKSLVEILTKAGLLTDDPAE